MPRRLVVLSVHAAPLIAYFRIVLGHELNQDGQAG